MQNSEGKEMTDLEWLARNVSRWHKDSHRLCYVGHENGYPDPRWPMNLDFGKAYSREQWQAERERLQNKPCWDDHPDAKCFVQTELGNWHKNTETEKVKIECGDWMIDDPNAVCGWVQIQSGEVLGDWRDTLESRPKQRQFNPPTSSLTDNQQMESAKTTGMCSDGEPCGIPDSLGAKEYCSRCPNKPESKPAQITFKELQEMGLMENSESEISSGGDNDYWVAEIKNPKRLEPYLAECEDLIEHFQMTFQEGEAFKALWRKGQLRIGGGKPGDTHLRNAEKVAHFGNRMVAIESRTKEQNHDES